MTVIKQKTVDGTTVKVKRRKTDRSGKQYEYNISRPGNPSIVGPRYTKKQAMREFRAIIDTYQNDGSPGSSSRSSSSSRSKKQSDSWDPSLPDLDESGSGDGDLDFLF